MVGGVQVHSQRSIDPMRATLTTISVAALLAVGAGSAAARPADVPIPRNDAPPPAQTDVPTAGTDAAQHAQARIEAGQIADHFARAVVAVGRHDDLIREPPLTQVGLRFLDRVPDAPYLVVGGENQAETGNVGH